MSIDDARQLRYGETPWDGISQADLLLEVQRMHAALIAAKTALQFCRAEASGGFWSLEGTGGRAAAKVELALSRSAAAAFESENVYRAFFRYAVDLLFTPELGFRWTACDGCKHLIGGNDLIGKPCPECAREGRDFNRRSLEWRDLAREEAATCPS